MVSSPVSCSSNSRYMTEHALIDVLRREIDVVVVVPQRSQRLPGSPTKSLRATKPAYTLG